MTALGAEDTARASNLIFSRIVDVLNQKIALQSISGEGITADHMKRSAQFVADLLREVGVEHQGGAVAQPRRHAGRLGGHRFQKRQRGRADRCRCTRTIDVQPVPDPSDGTPTRSSALKSARARTAAEPRTTAVESPFIPVR